MQLCQGIVNWVMDSLTKVDFSSTIITVINCEVEYQSLCLQSILILF